MRGVLIAAAALALSSPVLARDVLLPGGTSIPLVTVDELSSKTNNTGEPIRLRVRDDVRIGEVVAIPAGTPAVGQITDARGTGAFGVNGKLQLAPLYLQIAGVTVRLVGGELAQGETNAGTVAGLLTTGLVSGRSAKIRAGSPIGSRVMRDVRLPLEAVPVVTPPVVAEPAVTPSGAAPKP